MPDGRVKWFDPKTGEGRIDSSHPYSMRAEDAEPEARVPGARVHFDEERRNGERWAVNVRLIEGTRASPQHGRFGDLTGAEHPDHKGGEGLTRSAPERHPEVRPEVEGESGEVVDRWAEYLRAGDLGSAVALYAAHAALHVRGQSHRGRDEINGYLLGRNLDDLELHDVEVRGAATR